MDNAAQNRLPVLDPVIPMGAVQNPLFVYGKGFPHHVNEYAFLSMIREKIFWWNLETSDADPEHFWNLFVRIMEHCDEDLADELGQRTCPDEMEEARRLTRRIGGRLQRQMPMALVCRQFEKLENGPVKNFLMALLMEPIHTVTVMLLSNKHIAVGHEGMLHKIRLTAWWNKLSREHIRIYYNALGILPDSGALNRIHQLSGGDGNVVYRLGQSLPRDRILTESDIDEHLALIVETMAQDICQNSSGAIPDVS